MNSSQVVAVIVAVAVVVVVAVVVMPCCTCSPLTVISTDIQRVRVRMPLPSTLLGSWEGSSQSNLLQALVVD